MKIGVNDNTNFKFSRSIIDYWKSKGHEVWEELGANPAMGSCDLIYIDFLDNNFYYYFNNKVPKKRIAVRAIDIDVWMGRHRDPLIWEYMDDLITIFKPHYDRIEQEGHPPAGMHHLIKPGVDLDKFTFRKKPREFKVCMVTGDFWEMKNYLEGFRIFQLLANRYVTEPWELHIRGQHHSREMEQVCKDYIIEHSGLADRVKVYPPVGDMNEWYEQMDYILVPSLKEAFSYATAEAMAKGIKPVLNKWYGVDTIWPMKYVYNDLDEAVSMFYGDYEPEEYRSIIEVQYDLKRMLNEYDLLFNT